MFQTEEDKPVAKKAPVKAPSVDEDEDDDMSYFAKLAAED